VKNDAVTPGLLKAILEALWDLRDAARPGFLSAANAARYVGLGQRQFDAVAPQIPCTRINHNGRRLFKRDDLDRFMEKHRVG